MAKVNRARYFDQHTSPVVILLVALLGTYGQTAIGLLPLMVTSWVESNGFSESSAGFIGSATLVGMTLGLAAAVLLLKHRPHAWVATMGIFIALGGDILSIYQQAPLHLGIVRFIAGSGYGLVIASVVSWFARHEMADRCFGTFMLLQLLVFAGLFTLIPFLEPRIGPATSNYSLIALGSFCLLLAPLLRLNPPDKDETRRAKETRSVLFPDDVPRTISIAAVVAPGFVLMATVGFWAFLHRFGLSQGIAENRLGAILGLVTLSGIPASLAVIWLGGRLGRLVPILIGLTGLLIPMIMFGLGATFLGAYVMGGVLFTMAWSFSIPVMQAIQADLDATGELATLSTIPQSIGSAMGPVTFAMALGVGYYPLGFAMMTVLVLISLIMVIRPALAAQGSVLKKTEISCSRH